MTAFGQLAEQDQWYLWTTNSPGFSAYGVAIGPDGRAFAASSDGTIRVCSNGTWSTFVSNNFAPGLSFNTPLSIITDPIGNVYVADAGNNTVRKFSPVGTFLSQFGPTAGSAGSMSGVRDVAVSTNGLVYVVDNGNSRIVVFNADSSFNSLFVTNGNLSSQVNSPVSIAISDSGRVFVTQTYTSYHQEQNLGGDTFRMLKAFDLSGNPLFQIGLNDQRGFQDECNRGHDYLGPVGVRADRSGLVHVVSTACGTYYDCINNNDPNYQMYWRIFTTDGTLFQLNSFSFGEEWNTAELFWPCLAVGPDGTVIIADLVTGTMKTCLYAKRELQPLPRNAATMPEVLQVAQRPNTSIIDITVRGNDLDDAFTIGGLLIFTNGTQSLSNCLVPVSFTEGTGTNIGAPIPTGQPVRITWNAGQDWLATNLSNIRVGFIAKDARQGLLEYHSVVLPAFNGMGPLQISASPLIQSDFMQVFWWLLATHDPGITLSNGVIYGVGGAYDGQALCIGDNNSTANGRAYIFSKMNVRQATAAEVSWASQGPNIGITNTWSPAISVGGRPMSVNEYRFDPGPWGTNAWYIVPLQ